jgi:hypothetical protein
MHNTDGWVRSHVITKGCIDVDMSAMVLKQLELVMRVDFETLKQEWRFAPRAI